MVVKKHETIKTGESQRYKLCKEQKISKLILTGQLGLDHLKIRQPTDTKNQRHGGQIWDGYCFANDQDVIILNGAKFTTSKGLPDFFYIVILLNINGIIC